MQELEPVGPMDWLSGDSDHLCESQSSGIRPTADSQLCDPQIDASMEIDANKNGQMDVDGSSLRSQVLAILAYLLQCANRFRSQT